MLQEQESILGLEIAPEGIKILELQKTLQGLRLIRAEILAVSPEAFKEGTISDTKAIAQIIKDHLEAKNILAKKMVGVVDSSLTLMRLVRIPFMSEIEMKSMLEAEANQYVEFKHKEKAIDFCLLEEINEEGIKKVNIIFAAVLKNVIDSFIQVAKESGRELIAIDASLLAVIRALYGVNIKAASSEPLMLVMVNPKDIQLCIIKGNRPRFLHTVEIDIKEFITTKQEFIERLVFSVKLVLNYYSRAIHGQEDIHNIILNVNDPSLKDIDKELNAHLTGFVVAKANPLGRLMLDETGLSAEEKEEVALTFAPIIGAALRTEDTPEYPLSLNLVPPEKQRRILIDRELTLYVSSLTLLLAVFVILAGIFWLNIHWMQYKISLFEQQLRKNRPSLERIVRQYSNNIDLEKRINESAGIIGQADKDRSLFSATLLANVMLAVPDGLWLRGIDVQAEGETLTLTGSAASKAELLEYVESLTKEGYFYKVEPIFTESKAQKETINFTIKCQLKRS